MSKRNATTFSQSDDVNPTMNAADDDDDNYKPTSSTSPKKSKPNSNTANRLSKEQKQILIGMALDVFLQHPNWQAMSDATGLDKSTIRSQFSATVKWKNLRKAAIDGGAGI